MAFRSRLTLSDLAPIFEGQLDGDPAAGALREGSTDLDHPLMRARSRFVTVEGLTVIRGAHRVAEDLELLSEQHPPTVAMSFFLLGDSRGQWRESGQEIVTRPWTHNLTFFPEQRFAFQLSRIAQYETFEVNLSVEYFASLAVRYPELFERSFVPILRGLPFALHSQPATITPAMSDTIARIMSSEQHGVARRMFIEASVLDLLGLQISQHLASFRPAHPAKHLKRREIDRMNDARSLLLSRMADPPSLQELAHQVGTNEFALKRNFKTVFSDTVYGVLFDYRMQIALRLLMDTEDTIEKIAQEVGYASTAHFSAAFKRRFGKAPTRFRNRL